MQQSVHPRRPSLQTTFLLRKQPSKNDSTSNHKTFITSSLKNMSDQQKKAHNFQKASGFQEQNPNSFVSQSFRSIGDFPFPVKVSKRLTSFKNLSLQTSLMIVIKLMEEYQSVLLKNKDAKLNPDQIWITHSGNVLILTNIPKNSKSQYFHPTVHHQTKAGKRIMEIVSIYSCKNFEDFYSYYQRSLSKHPDCDFKHLKGLIKSYCACAKIELSNCISLGTEISKISSPKKSYRTLIKNTYRQKKIKTEVSCGKRRCFLFQNVKQNVLSPTKNFGTEINDRQLKNKLCGTQSPQFCKKKRKISIQIEGQEQQMIVQKFKGFKLTKSRIYPESCKVFEEKIQEKQEDNNKRTKNSLDTFKDSIVSTNKSTAYFGSFIKKSKEEKSFDSEQKNSEGDKKKYKNNVFSFVPSNLEEVESQEGQNSDFEEREFVQECSPKKKFPQKPKLDEQKQVFNLESLLKPCKNQTYQSIVIGKQPIKRDSKLEKLDKFIDTMYESMVSNE